MVKKVNDNATYLLRELDRTLFKIPIAAKCIKVFRRRDGRFQPDGFEPFENSETFEEDIEDAEEVLTDGEDI